jgi:hypothetical protein
MVITRTTARTTFVPGIMSFGVVERVTCWFASSDSCFEIATEELHPLN